MAGYSAIFTVFNIELWVNSDTLSSCVHRAFPTRVQPQSPFSTAASIFTVHTVSPSSYSVVWSGRDAGYVGIVELFELIV